MSERRDTTGRAIVTFSRSWQALAAVRSLGRRGVEVITGDEYALTPGALSRYSTASFTYPNPDSDREGFLDALEAAVREHAPGEGVPYVLMPIHRETYTVAAARERFEPHVRMALAPSEKIERVRDKGRLAELAREIGIGAPRTWTPDSAEDLRRALGEIPFPALVKLRRGAAGIGIEKVEDGEQAVAAFERLVERHRPRAGSFPIVQETAEGDDYCVTALFDHGRPKAFLTYRNVSKVLASAPGAVRETVEAPAPEAAACRLLETLGWHGIAQVDFVWNGDVASEPQLIEVNPRFFGGLFQAIASGVDYPWMLYRLALGEEIEVVPEVEVGVRTETPLLGLLATLQEIADNAIDMDRLEDAWKEARGRVDAGSSWWQGAQRLLSGLRESLNPGERLKQIRAIFEEQEDNLSQLLADDDPLAGLGLLYPVSIFLRHGKVTSDLLVGASKVEGEVSSEGR